jgi:hypothetical protein
MLQQHFSFPFVWHQQNPQYLPPKTQLHLDSTSSFSRDLNAFQALISIANDVLLQLLLLLLFLLEASAKPSVPSTQTQLHLDSTSSFSRDLNAFHTWIFHCK